MHVMIILLNFSCRLVWISQPFLGPSTRPGCDASACLRILGDTDGGEKSMELPAAGTVHSLN